MYLNIVFLTSLFAFITGDQQTGHHTLRYSIYVIVIYYVDLMRSCTLTNLKATCILLPNQIWYFYLSLTRGLGQFFGKGSRSPYFTSSPLSREDWASSWGRGVRHLIFNLVAGQFLGEGSRSLYFYLVTITQRGLDQFLREGSGSPYFYLVAITQRGLGQFLGEGSRSPHF